MSGEGFGLIGAVLALPIVAAAGVGWLAYQAGRGMVNGAKAINNHAKAARQRRELEMDSVNAELNQTLAGMNQISRQFNTQFENLARNTASQIEKAGNDFMRSAGNINTQRIEQYSHEINNRTAEINKSFMNDYSKISRDYANKISAGTAKLKQNVSRESEKNKAELAQLKNNVSAYKNKSRKMAEEAIKSAEYHIEYIRKHMNAGSSFEGKVHTLELNLNNARSNYNNGMYEASYSFAEDIKLMAMDVFNDMLIEKNETEGYRTMLIAEIGRLKSIVDANSEITFEYEGETIRGSIYDYSEGLIDGFKKSLEDIEKKSMDENISLKELKKCYNELSMELVPSFEKILRWSLKNLENSYIRIDVAQTITETIEEQNFVMTERGYKGDCETNDLYIKYKNSITKEEIMVIIKPEDKPGTVGTSYEVHQLTEGVNPDRQEEIRNDVNRGIIDFYNSHDISVKPCSKETVGKASRLKNVNISDIKKETQKRSPMI